MTPFYLEPLYYAFVALVAFCAWGAGFLWSKSEINELHVQKEALKAQLIEKNEWLDLALVAVNEEITANSRLRVDVARLKAQLKEQETAHAPS